MRELEVLVDGHLKLDFADIQEFFEQDRVRSAIKRLIEQALLAERDRYLDLGYYEHAPTARIDYRNGYYFRDLTTKLGVLCRLKVPRRAAVFAPNSFRAISAASKTSTNWCSRLFFAASPPDTASDK